MLLDAQNSTRRRTGPSPSSLVGSVGLHVLLIGWMFFGPSLSDRPPQPAKNIYQQLIEPNEKKLVWYNFRDKLPQVSPLERHGISRPPRTDRTTEKQTIVSNPRQPDKSKQMVYLPAPPREVDHEVPAPNLFAFAVPKLQPPPPKPEAKLFAPPPEVLKEILPPEPLPAAPDVQAAAAKVDVPQADALPKPVARPFVPPTDAKRAPQPDPTVPDAPKVAANSAKLDLPQADALPRPQPKRFVPPPEPKRPVRPDQPVPDAPAIAMATARPNMPARQFLPPPEPRRAARPGPTVPDAPKVGPTSAKLYLPQPGSLPKPQPKVFVPPRQATHAAGPAPSMPSAPAVGGISARVDLPQAGSLPKPQPRGFRAPASSKPPPGSSAPLPDAPQVASQRSYVPLANTPAAAAPGAPAIETAPALDAQAAAGNLTAAIVGLKPADQLVELPDSAHSAQFSSGPKRTEDGGKGEPVETAKIFVPDLMIRDGAMASPDATVLKKVMQAAAAPTSAANIEAAARAAAPTLRPETRLPGIIQVPSAPDPRFTGRNIYMVAIQMPNVTSFIGSWTMWFADREPMPGEVREMRPPVPTRKVDPKYVASAAAERVEGKVQLAAVIRRDGRTVDVDAIFEIPFRLEPLATKK
jgi:hypothetical protein